MSEERNLILLARSRLVSEYDHATQGAEWAEDELTQKLADTIERLICERDEARAEAFSLAANQCLHGLHGDAHGNPYCPGIAEAEARGYRKGIEDAAKVAGSHDGCCEDFADCGYCTKAHILALLEQTSDSNRPHPEIGAVPKSET